MDKEKLPEELPIKFVEKEEEKKKSKKLSLPETPSLPIKIIETEGVEEITIDTPDEVSNIPIKIIEVETEEVEKSAPPKIPTPDKPIKIIETEVDESTIVDSEKASDIPIKFIEGQQTQSKQVIVETNLLQENGGKLLQENGGNIISSIIIKSITYVINKVEAFVKKITPKSKKLPVKFVNFIKKARKVKENKHNL